MSGSAEGGGLLVSDQQREGVLISHRRVQSGGRATHAWRQAKATQKTGRCGPGDEAGQMGHEHFSLWRRGWEGWVGGGMRRRPAPQCNVAAWRAMGARCRGCEQLCRCGGRNQVCSGSDWKRLRLNVQFAEMDAKESERKDLDSKPLLGLSSVLWIKSCLALKAAGCKTALPCEVLPPRRSGSADCGVLHQLHFMHCRGRGNTHDRVGSQDAELECECSRLHLQQAHLPGEMAHGTPQP